MALGGIPLRPRKLMTGQRLDMPDFTVEDMDVKLANGETISVAELKKRLEDLERTYMEEKLLGETKDPGII